MTPVESTREHPLVLVVDDDANTRLLTRASLEQHGFEVVELRRGKRL